MAFQDNLAAMSDISRLSGLDVCGENGGVLHHIPAAPGKLGSLKLYNALAERFGGRAGQSGQTSEHRPAVQSEKRRFETAAPSACCRLTMQRPSEKRNNVFSDGLFFRFAETCRNRS